MTQHEANKIFQSDLGRQLTSFFSTSDDCVFVRYKEALDHAYNDKLPDKEIIEWFEEY